VRLFPTCDCKIEKAIREDSFAARDQSSSTMIFRIFVTVFFFGFALLIGILSVMRGLYSFSICQPPLIPSDSAAKVSVDEDHEQPQLPSDGRFSATCN
jgi:hypothetical protein